MAPLDALCLDEPPRDAALEQLHDGRCNSLTLAPGSADDAELFAAIGAAARNRTLTSLPLGARPLGHAAFAQPLWRVCFGGAFAATRSQIWARRAETWRRLSDALSRGNNIEEGHYSERLWGLLLAPPLTDDAAAAMLCAGHAGDSTTGLFKSCRCDAKYEACVARPQVR